MIHIFVLPIWASLDINKFAYCSLVEDKCSHVFVVVRLLRNDAYSKMDILDTAHPIWILLLQTWDLYERRELVGLVDTSLDGDFDAEEACRFLKIGLLCTQDAPKLRPSMSTVVKLLTGEKDLDDSKITKPGLITDFMDLKVRGPPKAKSQKKTSYDKTNSETKSKSNVFTDSGKLDESTLLSSGNSTSAATSLTASYD